MFGLKFENYFNYKLKLPKIFNVINFDKIKENPENPNLDETELAAFLLLAQNLNPDTKSSTPDGKTANATPSPSTPTSSPSTEVAPSGQPNAKLYNPLNTTTV